MIGNNLGAKLEKGLQNRLVTEKDIAEALAAEGIQYGAFEALKRYFVQQDVLIEMKQETDRKIK